MNKSINNVNNNNISKIYMKGFDLMKDIKDVNTLDIIQFLNSNGKKKALKEFNIKASDWNKLLKDRGISYSKVDKCYCSKMLDDRTVKEENDVDNTEKDESSNVENKLIEEDDKNEKECNDIEQSDILDFIKKTKITEKNEHDIKLIQESVVENKKDKNELKDYTLYKQMFPKELIKALEFKALAEGTNVELLVVDLLYQSIDNKYFEGISV